MKLQKVIASAHVIASRLYLVTSKNRYTRKKPVENNVKIDTLPLE